MKYAPPIGSTDPNAGYVDRTGHIPGSPVPAAAIEPSMREIINVIEEAELTPDGADLTQLAQAINALITRAMPKQTDAYELCEFYHFRHPTLKPGFQPAQGGLLANAATLYPKAWAYLQTVEGQKLCKTEAAWQAMTTATWATLANGANIGWNGIGGAPFYAPNTATGALRLPDLRGMYAEAAGFDSLGVGGVHGDATRLVTANIPEIICPSNSSSGSSYWASTGVYGTHPPNPTWYKGGWWINTAREVPTANKNQPRAWGALACVYLGLPS